MKTYGRQHYTMSEAALAYATNYLQGDKFRIKQSNVEALQDGKWVKIDSARNCAQAWDGLNQ